MPVNRFLIVLLGACLVWSCSPRSEVEGSPSVLRGNTTAYGEDGSANDGSFEEETVDREDPILHETFDDVDSENLAILDEEPGLDLDWEPIYFDFDKSELTIRSQETLREYAQRLNRYRELKVLLEGHCDSRGTEDYNLALGERRAQTVKRFLVGLGIESERIRTISYGELQPTVLEENESAWARNRRVGFTF